MPSLSIAISTMGLQVLSMINININALRGSPVFVPLTIMNILVRLEPQITLKGEYLYRSSIRQLYISGTSKYCSVSKPKASAKSIKTDVNLVLL